MVKTLDDISSHPAKSDMEIIICPNGLTDSEYLSLLKLKSPSVKVTANVEQGLGRGLKEGIKEVATEWFLITGHELPFGWSDYAEWIKERHSYDIIVGSKLHEDTKLINLPFKRRVLSKIYSFIKSLLFPYLPRDTQGTIFVKTSIGMLASNKVRANEYFFTTEFLYHLSQEGKVPIKEVPVVYEIDNYTSSISWLKHGVRFLVDLFKLRDKK